MEKLRDSLATIGYILFFGFTIFGFWHVSKKHSAHEMNVCEWAFPVATYHGLEFFWHDDFAGVDWKGRNERDFKMITYFYIRYKGDSAKYQLTKDIEEFSNDINKYPADKLNYLKSGAKEYILMTSQLEIDITKYCQNYFQGDTSAFIYSDLTNTHLLNLKKSYYFDEEISSFGLNKTLHDRLRTSNDAPFTNDEKETFMKRMEANYDDGLFYYKKAYKDIFKVEYK